MQLPLDVIEIDKLQREIEESLRNDADIIYQRERSALRIKYVLTGIARRLRIDGQVDAYGSYANGFKTGGSDLDVVFTGQVAPQEVVSVLDKFAAMVSSVGFHNVTKIFQANVPLVKITDMKSQIEVDFCINNLLGVRNSKLLYAYCQYDERVLQLGKLVKEWAKNHELVGKADGCLNSYAYMLLVIHFLQMSPTPVVQNLQMLASKAFPVVDSKWGHDDRWETKFEENVDSLPPSKNEMQVAELLIRFFYYYTHEFDWRKHAVCVRMNKPGLPVDKFMLTSFTSDEQWYVEDPFDLKHNLASTCSSNGRERILMQMTEAFNLLNQNGSWAQACPPLHLDAFFLKCRISPGVTPQGLLEEFLSFDLAKLHFPKPDGTNRMGNAFLEFNSGEARRRAHTKNESYVADCKLVLHHSTQHSLREAVNQFPYSTYEMASYKMQKQVLQSRVSEPLQADMPWLPMQRGFPQDPFTMSGPPGPPPSAELPQPSFPQPHPVGARSRATHLPQMPPNGWEASWEGMGRHYEVGPPQNQNGEVEMHDKKATAFHKQEEDIYAGSRVRVQVPKQSFYMTKSGGKGRPEPKGPAPKKIHNARFASESRQGSWITAHIDIGVAAQKDSTPIFTKEQQDSIEKVKKYYRDKFKPDGSSYPDEIRVQVPVKDSLPPHRGPPLSPNQCKKLQDFSKWLSSCEVG